MLIWAFWSLFVLPIEKYRHSGYRLKYVHIFYIFVNFDVFYNWNKIINCGPKFVAQQSIREQLEIKTFE
jgi:hypothetical protein